MLIAILKSLFKFVLTIGGTLGIVVMMMCMAFVVISFIRGDIRINIIRDKTKKENE